MKTIVTKGEFAKRVGRGPSAVSNWIADGRITQAALVGQGVRARIWVEQAERDLARNLDPSQQIAQDRPLPLRATCEAEAAPPASAPSAPPPVEDEDLRRRRKADADSAEHQAELNRLKAEREAGRWVDAAEAQKAFARQLTKVVTEVEAWATQTLARDLGDKHGLDWRTLSVDIRSLWRTFRTASADAAARRDGGEGASGAPE